MQPSWSGDWHPDTFHRLREVTAMLLDQAEVTKGRVTAVRFIRPMEYLRALAGEPSNDEPGGGRTHDIHLKRVLLYH